MATRRRSEVEDVEDEDVEEVEDDDLEEDEDDELEDDDDDDDDDGTVTVLRGRRADDWLNYVTRTRKPARSVKKAAPRARKPVVRKADSKPADSGKKGYFS